MPAATYSRYPLAGLLAAVVAASWGCIETASGPAASARDRSPAPVRARVDPQFIAAPDGEVRAVVARALDAARTEGRTLLVYIGATWCEPCEAFHRAVQAGQLDHALADVRFLEFDADVDRDRLRAAGYEGRLIPRFTVPNADGSPSDASIEGGIAGDGAVQHILERLEPLLARARRPPA